MYIMYMYDTCQLSESGVNMKAKRKKTQKFGIYSNDKLQIDLMKTISGVMRLHSYSYCVH